MAGPSLACRVLALSSLRAASLGGRRPFASVIQALESDTDVQNRGNDGSGGNGIKGKWLTLPPFDGSTDATALGRAVAAQSSATASAETTAIKWVTMCCPKLPRNLVQKLFRLRQVRRETSILDQAALSSQTGNSRLKRVTAKDLMNFGDRVYLPASVKETLFMKEESHINIEELNFVRCLVLYKDSSIIVVNKPPGMPVQGGTGIKWSLDELAVSCLKYDYPAPPRLVHRLDRDCSGILVMGRTQTSATFLHSIFREKTAGASSNDDTARGKRILQRRYWALVIGSPRRSKGLISAPLRKIVVDDGKSDRITVVDNVHSKEISCQHAVTEYQVIDSSNGYTWLELSPLTGRKHQLRVHCAEVLGTPIVGDYKYGWRSHRKLEIFPDEENSWEKASGKGVAFGLDLESGSISDKQPRLHLHCRQIVLPNISQALQRVGSSSRLDLSELESLELVAPLPPFMQKSLGILKSPSHTELAELCDTDEQPLDRNPAPGAGDMWIVGCARLEAHDRDATSIMVARQRNNIRRRARKCCIVGNQRACPKTPLTVHNLSNKGKRTLEYIGEKGFSPSTMARPDVPCSTYSSKASCSRARPGRLRHGKAKPSGARHVPNGHGMREGETGQLGTCPPRQPRWQPRGKSHGQSHGVTCHQSVTAHHIEERALTGCIHSGH